MDDRVKNFLSNWIDANILHPSSEPDHDPEKLQAHYLTDAVAAGIELDDVNEHWPEAERLIQQALLDRTTRTAH